MSTPNTTATSGQDIEDPLIVESVVMGFLNSSLFYFSRCYVLEKEIYVKTTNTAEKVLPQSNKE